MLMRQVQVLRQHQIIFSYEMFKFKMIRYKMSVKSSWLRNVYYKMLAYEMIWLQNECYELLVMKYQSYDLCGNHYN